MNERECDEAGAPRLPTRLRPWLRVVKLLLASVAAALGILRSLGAL